MVDRALSDVSITNLTSLQSGDELYVIRGGVPHRVDFDKFFESGVITGLTLKGTITAGTYTPGSNDTTEWSRFGNIVTFKTRISGTLSGSSGFLVIENAFPYVSAGVNAPVFTMAYSYLTHGASDNVVAYITPSSKNLRFQKQTDGASWGEIQSSAVASISPDSEIIISGSYII